MVTTEDLDEYEASFIDDSEVKSDIQLSDVSDGERLVTTTKDGGSSDSDNVFLDKDFSKRVRASKKTNAKGKNAARYVT